MVRSISFLTSLFRREEIEVEFNDGVAHGAIVEVDDGKSAPPTPTSLLLTLFRLSSLDSLSCMPRCAVICEFVDDEDDEDGVRDTCIAWTIVPGAHA